LWDGSDETAERADSGVAAKKGAILNVVTAGGVTIVPITYPDVSLSYRGDLM
jgi:hypothetical protein